MNRAYYLELSLRNPLHVPLRHVALTLHAKNLNIHHDEIIPLHDLLPGEETTFRMKIEVPEVPGVYTVIVALSAVNMPSVVKDFDIVVA